MSSTSSLLATSSNRTKESSVTPVTDRAKQWRQNNLASKRPNSRSKVLCFVLLGCAVAAFIYVVHSHMDVKVRWNTGKRRYRSFRIGRKIPGDHEDKLDEQLEKLKEYLDNKISDHEGQLKKHEESLSSHDSTLKSHGEKLSTQKETWQEWLRSQVQREVEKSNKKKGETSTTHEEDVKAMDAAAAKHFEQKKKKQDNDEDEKDSDDEHWKDMAEWLNEPTQQQKREEEHTDPFEQLMNNVFNGDAGIRHFTMKSSPIGSIVMRHFSPMMGNTHHITIPLN